MTETVQRKNLNDSPIHGEKGGFSIFSIVLGVIIVFLFAFLMFLSFIGVCYVQQNSMNDNYFNGDFVMVHKHPFSVKKGDVVVVDGEGIAAIENKDLIKRVIATGGDTLRFERISDTVQYDFGGAYYPLALYKKNNGEDTFKKIDEPYIKEQMKYYINLGPSSPYYDVFEKDGDNDFSNNTPKEFKIKDKHLFLMGDNRNESADSRNPQISTFSTSKVVGKVFDRLIPNSSFEKFILWVFRAKRPAVPS